MTVIATGADEAAIAELIRIREILEMVGWRHIPSTEEVNTHFPVYKCLLVKPGLRIAIEKTGSAQCDFVVEDDGSPTIRLSVRVPTPMGKADVASSIRLREWAAAACSAVIDGERSGIDAVRTRMSRIGHLVVHMTGMNSDDGIRGVSWNPATPWSSPKFGDMLRFRSIPNALSRLLVAKATCLLHVRRETAATPQAAGSIDHVISRMEVLIDEEDRLDMPAILKLVDELGITPTDLEPDGDEPPSDPTFAQFARRAIPTRPKP